MSGLIHTFVEPRIPFEGPKPTTRWRLGGTDSLASRRISSKTLTSFGVYPDFDVNGGFPSRSLTRNRAKVRRARGPETMSGEPHLVAALA